MEFSPCRQGGPFSKTSALVQTIGRVKSVKINKCDPDPTGSDNLFINLNFNHTK